MGRTKYMWLIFYFTIVNFYVSYNSYLMVNYRGKYFYESDYVQGYYCIWCDWFSNFWASAYGMMQKNKSNARVDQKEEM